jgi:hypothetical protein
MNGTYADRAALEQHRFRTSARKPSRFHVTTYALRIPVAVEAFTANMFNLGNRHYMRNSKRGGLRRRYTPYWGE